VDADRLIVDLRCPLPVESVRAGAVAGPLLGLERKLEGEAKYMEQEEAGARRAGRGVGGAFYDTCISFTLQNPREAASIAPGASLSSWETWRDLLSFPSP
jgi:hypothetical protein